LIPKTILITGASGLIGEHLTAMLLRHGYRVKHLGRAKKEGPVSSYVWDVDRGYIEEGALAEVNAIIHLAGTGIAEKRWTKERKKEIMESRTKSTMLLFDQVKRGHPTIETFISASGISYYGFGSGQEVFTEESRPGNDFLADVVTQWETAADNFQSLNIRTVKIRTGIVLSGKGGALKEIVRPVRWGIGAQLGTGNQWMSWIHISDLCRLYIFVLENKLLQGAYNGVGPAWSTNREVTESIAHALQRPLWLPPVPGFVLKVWFGEMADLVLLGSKVSSEKIQQAGFVFEYAVLDEAIRSALQN
jgi:uncharacterized protein